jgi:hypothetical protein
MVGLKPPPPPNQGFGAVFTKAWEDPLSLVPSPSDLAGVVDRLKVVYTTTTIPSMSDITSALGDIRNIKRADLHQRLCLGASPPPPFLSIR